MRRPVNLPVGWTSADWDAWTRETQAQRDAKRRRTKKMMAELSAADSRAKARAKARKARETRIVDSLFRAACPPPPTEDLLAEVITAAELHQKDFPEQGLHALYRHFDSKGRLLYVGRTVDPGRRTKAHRREKSWWLEVARMEIEYLPSAPALKVAETRAIKSENPKYNIAGRTIPQNPWDAPPMENPWGATPKTEAEWDAWSGSGFMKRRGA